MQKAPKSKIAAFFDVDNTLLEVNSARLYFRYFQKRGFITWQQYARMIWFTAAHRIGILKEEKALPQLLSIVAGWDERKAQELSSEAFEALVCERIDKQILRKLQEHKKSGHHIVLITASPVVTADPIASFVEADHLLASMFHVKDGRYSGEILHLMYAQGKVEPMREYAKAHHIDLKQSFAYADSYTDRFMLELVGHPVAVNPDPKLKEYAKEKGWEIIKR